MLFISDYLAKGNATRRTPSLLRVVVDCVRRAALVPDLSRSGSTITSGLLCGYSREFAVKFSFILSIPAVIGANILNVPDIIANPVPSSDIPAYLLGMAAALVTGILAMKLLLYISKKSNFRIFSYYCVAVGILAIIFG